jgi:hypothetical protein
MEYALPLRGKRMENKQALLKDTRDWTTRKKQRISLDCFFIMHRSPPILSLHSPFKLLQYQPPGLPNTYVKYPPPPPCTCLIHSLLPSLCHDTTSCAAQKAHAESIKRCIEAKAFLRSQVTAPATHLPTVSRQQVVSLSQSSKVL